MVYKLLTGDALTHLRTLRDQTIHTCITSPPYFGLRDYGTASWSGGGPTCTHRAPDEAGQTLKPSAGQREHAGRFAGPTCFRCGAVRVDTQIGLESSPAEYVQKLVEVFREVRRVLRDDGTFWLNLGDSYNTYPANRGRGPGLNKNNHAALPAVPSGFGLTTKDLKNKDLMGIPWRVAFALQQDGWYLRQDIIWHKPNPMPESVRDRCTKAHEYLFLLSKSPTYYFDSEAMQEPAIYAPGKTKEVERAKGYYNGKWNAPVDGSMRNDSSFKAIRETRNRRSVWTVPTKPFREAHFATFPPDLIRPCVLAGSPVAGVVLDPFSGATTTGVVATEHGRHFVGIELNPEYVAMSEARLRRGTKPLPPALPIVATTPASHPPVADKRVNQGPSR